MKMAITCSILQLFEAVLPCWSDERSDCFVVPVRRIPASSITGRVSTYLSLIIQLNKPIDLLKFICVKSKCLNDV